MSKSTIKPHYPNMDLTHYPNKWKPCRLCTTKWITAELKFDSGSTVPVVGETLTGATSGDTGVVTEIETLISGSWAGGDAAGYLHVDTVSGDDAEQYSIFSDDELINGSIGLTDILTADGQGNVKIWAILWPKSQMVKYEGKWYCEQHAGFRMRPRERDKDRLVVKEDERGKE